MEIIDCGCGEGADCKLALLMGAAACLIFLILALLFMFDCGLAWVPACLRLKLSNLHKLPNLTPAELFVSPPLSWEVSLIICDFFCISDIFIPCMPRFLPGEPA